MAAFLFTIRNRSLKVPFFALRLYSTSASTAPKPLQLRALGSYYRKPAMEAAVAALKDYLYTTRCLPFSLAERIAANSPIALSSYLCRLRFPSSKFKPSDSPQFFRHSFSFNQPINEFEFFLESIGVFDNLPETSELLFLADDSQLVEGVTQLIHLGFPYGKLGLLYPSKALWVAPSDLLRRFARVQGLGFQETDIVVAMCFAFPRVLVQDDVDCLLQDLRDFLAANRVVDSMESNVDSYLGICEKVKIFYEMGSSEGSIGSLLRENDWVIFDVDEKELRKRLGFFAKLGMKEDLGRFVLQNCKQVFEIDFELAISMPEYLCYVGLEQNQAKDIISAHPYIVGKNKLGNLPGIICAVGLSEWFLGKVQQSMRFLSTEFVLGTLNSNPSIEEEFVKGLKQAKLDKRGKIVDCKVEFLQSIGFGTNKFTARYAAALSGTKEDLEGRFEVLSDWGIEHKRICKMLSTAPKLLNQNMDTMKEKIDFLCNHLGYDLDYLDSFPAFLCFDLKNRIKPRYRILEWLKEAGLLKKSFAPATVLAGSEKKFIDILYSIHPAAPKQWLEKISSRNHKEYYRKNLFSPKANFGAPLVVKSS